MPTHLIELHHFLNYVRPPDTINTQKYCIENLEIILIWMLNSLVERIDNYKTKKKHKWNWMLSIMNVMNEVNFWTWRNHIRHKVLRQPKSTHYVSKTNSIEHLLTKQTCPDSIRAISAIYHVTTKTKSITMKLKPTEYIERDPIIEKNKNNITVLYWWGSGAVLKFPLWNKFDFCFSSLSRHLYRWLSVKKSNNQPWQMARIAAAVISQRNLITTTSTH